MALPYVTEAKARMIAQEVVKESATPTPEPQPTPAGGTKLYKHTVEITLYIEGEELNTTCIFITTSGQSLKGTKNEVYTRGYVSGVVDKYGTSRVYTPIIAITNQSEPALYYLSDDGNLERADFVSYFGNDNIEEL